MAAISLNMQRNRALIALLARVVLPREKGARCNQREKPPAASQQMQAARQKGLR